MQTDLHATFVNMDIFLKWVHVSLAPKAVKNVQHPTHKPAQIALVAGRKLLTTPVSSSQDYAKHALSLQMIALPAIKDLN